MQRVRGGALRRRRSLELLQIRQPVADRAEQARANYASALAVGRVPTLTAATLYPIQLLRANRRFALDRAVPTAKALRFAIAAYNAGRGGALSGHRAGDVDANTAHGDYSSDGLECKGGRWRSTSGATTCRSENGSLLHRRVRRRDLDGARRLDGGHAVDSPRRVEVRVVVDRAGDDPDRVEYLDVAQPRPREGVGDLAQTPWVGWFR
jgi:hypothetical protein